MHQSIVLWALKCPVGFIEKIHQAPDAPKQNFGTDMASFRRSNYLKFLSCIKFVHNSDTMPPNLLAALKTFRKHKKY